MSSAGATAFTIIKPELVRAATQLLTGSENVDLVAMGDTFDDRLEKSLATIRDGAKFPDIQSKVKVEPDRHCVGFDAYKKILASDIDIVMLCTPPGYRPMHFEAAIEARRRVFAEKPFGADPVGVGRFMAAAKKSEQAP
jgi:myo-inositol 2-dehydrogenase/D-chiro-inositol 1-dehydrogenase